MRVYFAVLAALVFMLVRPAFAQPKLVVTLLSKDGHPLSDQVIKLDNAKAELLAISITDSLGQATFDTVSTLDSIYCLPTGKYHGRGGVVGVLQATGDITISSDKTYSLTIIQDILYSEYVKIERTPK